MDEILLLIFSVPTLIFCLSVWVLIWVLRKGVESIWKGAKGNKIWNEFLLPIIPILMGVGLMLLIPNYPVPENMNFTGARVLLGMAYGLLSAQTYKILKKFLKKNTDEETEKQAQEKKDDPTDILDDE